MQRIAQINPLEVLGLQNRVLTFGATAIASFGVHALEAPSAAVADNCVTTTTVESTTTVCGPDQPDPNTGTTTPTPAPATTPPKPEHHSHTGGIKSYYKDPFRVEVQNRTFFARRIDQGEDESGTGAVYPIGDSRVTDVTTSSSYWANEGGNVVVYRLSDGPARGKSVYVSENCSPNPALYIGKRVFAGKTALCYMHDAFPYTETGWAQGGRGNDKPIDYSLYSNLTDGSEMAVGLNFSNLMQRLGAPGGNTNPGHVSYNMGTIMGRLPAGLPQWNNLA
ncbi:MAG TPA: hypothetical protein VFC50_02795 [Candidatus Dormibacteraeota bacterium]|nr:hypothetical protein [Candidatus Dormibacteraeota bacterium]